MAEDIKEEYRSSLKDLTFNQKPLINALTLVAEENVQFAADIVSVIESHIAQAPKDQKLPSLYLVDSIVKNCRSTGYGELFSRNLVKTFAAVFEAVDEKTRQAMFKLRQTWTSFFQPSRLCLLDIKVHQIDPAWPVSPVATPAAPPPPAVASTSAMTPSSTIHVNPKFVAPAPAVERRNERDPRQEELMQRQQELLKMKQSKKASELEAVKSKQQSTSQSLKSVVTVPSTSQQDPRLKRIKEEPRETSRSASGNGRSSASAYRQRSPETQRFAATNGGGKKVGYHRLDKPYVRPGGVDMNRVKREQSYSPELPISEAVGGSSRGGRSQTSDITEVFEDFDEGPRQRVPRAPPGISINLGYTGRRGKKNVAVADSTVDTTGEVVSSSDSIPDSPGEIVRSGVGSLDSPRTLSPTQSNGRDLDLRGVESRNLPLKKRKRGGTDTDSDTQKAPSPLASESEGSDAGISRERRPKQTVVVNVDSSGDEAVSLFGGKDVDLRTTPMIGPIRPTNIKKEVVDETEYEAARGRNKRIRGAKPAEPTVSPWMAQIQPVAQPSMVGQSDLMSTNWAGLSGTQRDQLAVAADSQLRNGQIQRDQYDMIVRNLQVITGSAPWAGMPVAGMQQQPVMPNYQFQVKREFDFRQFDADNQRVMIRGFPTGGPTPSGPTTMRTDLTRPDGEKEKPAAAIPANKTIYVGRTGYEVQYINDVAFIERNGLPHRIYFVGPPRDVIVDGTPYLLAFGETKTINIDGQQHTIRFGGPGRELIMGGFPFRGFFDGAPILATINNVAHKIQLCGPPPEVKIDPEPDYELSRDCAIAHKQRGLQRGPYHDGSRSGPTPGAPVLRPQQNFYPQENVYGMAPVNQMLNQAPMASAVRPMMTHPVVNQTLPLATSMGNVMMPEWDGGQQQLSVAPVGVAAVPIPSVQPIVSTAQAVSPAPAPAPFSLDVNDLLKKLMTKGLIGSTATASQSTAAESRAADSDVRASPPVSRRADWSSQGGRDAGQQAGGPKEIQEKRTAQPTNLAEFQMNDLKIRFQSVIDRLYPEGLQCGNCGLRFADTDDEKYSRHLDWHFQLNKKEKDRRAPSRPWYLVVEDWSNVDEMADETSATRAKSSVFEKAEQQKAEAAKAKAPVVATVSVVPANDKHKFCDTCKEEFEQVYDEDEEIWNFRNAIQVNGKVYHPLCYEDVPDTPTSESASGGPLLRRDSLRDDMDCRRNLLLSAEANDTSAPSQVLDNINGGVLPRVSSAPVIKEELVDGGYEVSGGTPLRDEGVEGDKTPVRDEPE